VSYDAMPPYGGSGHLWGKNKVGIQSNKSTEKRNE